MSTRPVSAANSQLAQALAGILRQHGKGILDDRDRLTFALRDYSGGQGRGVYVLMAALDEGIPQRLANARQNIPPEVFRSTLVRRLHSNRGIDLEQAAWAVDAWAEALELPPEKVDPAVVEPLAVPDVVSFQAESRRQCPYCGAVVADAICPSCRRDTTGPRKICPSCKKMTPVIDSQCWNCGSKFRSDLWWIVPLIVGLFILAFVLSIVIRSL